MKTRKLSVNEWEQLLDQHKHILHFNRIELQSILKGSTLFRDIPIGEQTVPAWQTILGCDSPIKTGTVNGIKVPYQSKLLIHAYYDTAETAKDIILENPFIYVAGDIREIKGPSRMINAPIREKIALLLEVEFDDPIIDTILTNFKVYSKKDQPFENMIALLGTDGFNKDDYPKGTPLHSDFAVLATTVTQGEDNQYINNVTLQGIVFQTPDYKPIGVNSENVYKIAFKVMVKRPEGERFDVFRCIWITDQWQEALNKLNPGYPIHLRGTLESDKYRSKYYASDAEILAVANTLGIPITHPVIVGDEFNEGLLDILELKFDPETQTRPGVKVRTVHEVWVKTVFFNEEDFIY